MLSLWETFGNFQFPTVYMKLVFIVLSAFIFNASCLAQERLLREESFRLGMILPLSGPAADYGQSIVNSIELLREEHPELLSNIKIYIEDAQHIPTKAISAFNKLVDKDEVNLLYTWGVPFCKTLAPIAEARRVPLVGQCIDKNSTANRSFVFRFMNDTEQYQRVLATELAARGFDTLKIVIADHPYLEEMYVALQESLQGGQKIEVIDRYQISDLHFQSTISKLKHGISKSSLSKDAIGVFLYPG